MILKLSDNDIVIVLSLSHGGYELVSLNFYHSLFQVLDEALDDFCDKIESLCLITDLSGNLAFLSALWEVFPSHDNSFKRTIQRTML